MKSLSLAVSSVIIGMLVATGSTILLSKSSNAQELESINLGCTQNLRTILRQQAPDYCTSTEADSGILFDRFNATRNPDRSIYLEFRVFNRGSADGLVEVYDRDENLKDIKIIEGNKPPTGLIQSGYDLFTKVPASFFSRYPLGDARRNLEEQNITVTIPAGGSVKITKSSNFAIWYNTAMLALEVAQFDLGNSNLTKSETTKQLVQDFAKEFGTQASINIFSSEPSLQSIVSRNFVDPEKLAEVLQKLVQYTTTIESDPSKNPILGAFSDIYVTGGNYGLETAIDKYIMPGLGTFARVVRIGGDGLITLARAIDIHHSLVYGSEATVTLRDASRVSTEVASFDHKQFVMSKIEDFKDKIPDFIERTEYFYTKTDLNNDGSQEIILVIFSPICGAWECNGYILQKNGSEYRTIGTIGVMSSGGEVVAVQQSVSNGYMDIATFIYNSEAQRDVWKLHKFDGTRYQNTFQNLNSPPSQIILNARRGSGLRL